jgi:hypothetical protein
MQIESGSISLIDEIKDKYSKEETGSKYQTRDPIQVDNYEEFMDFWIRQNDAISGSGM